MPIYEYQCANCHHQFDVLQKLSDDPVKKCPECSKDMAVRLVSAAGFQLKGTGWYATDFKEKKAPATKSDSNAAPKETSSTDKKTKEPATTQKSTAKGEAD
jgi:putative FmdB family regulatory protein